MTHSGPMVRKSLGSRRGTFGMAAGLLLSVACCLTSVPVSSASNVPVGQALVVLSYTHAARAAPSMAARTVMTVSARRPLTGARTVLPALGYTTTRQGRTWVHVRLPGRPNSSTGWMTAAGTTASWTAWRLSVNLGARRVTVYQRGRVVRRFPAVVGKPSTPTPQGSFFIEESLSLSAQASGAPFALATSARSDVLQEFDGGPGQIALHGMGNLAGALGTAASHGCIRLDTPDITWLAAHIPAGTPLSIGK
jgi:L,D-transpeptidase-like protein